MATTQKKSGDSLSARQWTRRGWELSQGSARVPILGAALVLLFTMGAWALWQHVRPVVLSTESYLVTWDDVEITPPPVWIQGDFREQVARRSSLFGTPLSLLEDDLTPQVAEAFQLHPWVKQVITVRKTHPAWVQVDLEYRKPVALVEVADGLQPVDSDGTRLPPLDFARVDSRHLPRLGGFQTALSGVVGAPWGDPWIMEAARIASLLQPMWEPLHLARIEPILGNPSGKRRYALRTLAGQTIVWGAAPDKNLAEDAEAQRKLEVLSSHQQRHDGLTGLESL